jgi:hypothetical protein
LKITKLHPLDIVLRRMDPLKDHLDPRLGILSLVVLLIVLFATPMHEGSDPKFTLLVAQSIVENGTIKLDSYQDDLLLGEPFQIHVGKFIREINGHYYNYFPVGPSIITLPIVAVTSKLGFDMSLGQHNFPLQRVLASVTSVIMLWIVYGIARCYLGPIESIVIAGIAVLGSGLISTLGSALWSINFSAIFIGLSLLLLVRYETGRSSTIHPIFLGLLLFLCYFSRASTAAFIAVVLIYLLVKDRKMLLITGATALIFLLLFAVWSRSEYGTWLPAYYSVGRFRGGRTPLLFAVYGHLFSPSRGLFTFSPFFLLVIPGAFLFGRKIYREPVVWLAVGWLILLILASSTAVSWWAGYSYGPRILTEAVLALVLLSIIMWREAKEILSPRWNRMIAALFLILGAAGIFIHSYQGLYNANTAGWNEKFVPVPPNIEIDALFDWRYPQFLATGNGLCRSQEELMRDILAADTTLGAYQWGSSITHLGDSEVDFKLAASNTGNDEKSSSNGENLPPGGVAKSPPGNSYVFLPSLRTPGNDGLFIGWTDSGANGQAPYRWSECETVSIAFLLGDVETIGRDFELAITAGANGKQQSTVLLNGAEVGEWLFTSPPDQPETAVFKFEGSALKRDSLNEIKIELPDAAQLSRMEWRRLGLSFYQLAIYPVDEPPVPWEPPSEKPPAGYP